MTHGCPDRPGRCFLPGSLASLRKMPAALDHHRHRCCLPPPQALIAADQVGRTAYLLTAPYLLPVLERGLQALDALGKTYLKRDLQLAHHSRTALWT